MSFLLNSIMPVLSMLTQTSELEVPALETFISIYCHREGNKEDRNLVIIVRHWQSVLQGTPWLVILVTYIYKLLRQVTLT